MKRFYEVTAIIGTLLMSAGLVACGTTAENVTRTDMVEKQSTAVKIQLSEENAPETETEAVEATISETPTETEIVAEDETDSPVAETAENIETPQKTEQVQTTKPVVTTAPTITTAVKTTTKATTKATPKATTKTTTKETTKTTEKKQETTAQIETQLEPAPAPTEATAPTAPEPDPVTPTLAVEDDIPNTEAPTDPIPTAPPIIVTGDEMIFSYGGQSLTLGQSADSFVNTVPPAQEPIEAPNYLGDGKNINYIYNDFTIYVWQDENGVNQINGISITGTGASTNRNITIGSSADDVINAYGSQYNLVGSYYVYNYDIYCLRFAIENGAVKEISYDYQ